MQRTKKVISALLAVVMVISLFAVNVTAGAPAPSGSYKITIAYEICDAEGNPITEVTPGETVTVKVYGNSSTASDNMTTFINSIYFDEDVYTYVDGSVQWLGIADWVDPDSSALTFMNSSSTAGAYTKSSAAWTDEEKAAKPNWDSFLYVAGIQLAGTTYYVQENANTAMYSFQLKVADTAVPGTDASIGCPASVHYVSRASYNYIRTVATGTIGSGEIEPTTEYTATVASAAPELDVTAASNQIRYNKNTDGSFKDFDVRTRATIDAAALQALVGATANDDVELSIVEAGFVYGADIDAATAATVAAGTAVDGYTKTTVSYIQNDGTNYVFTYLVTGLTTENAAASDFEAVGYITLTIDGTNYTFCYDAETAVSPSAMYNSTYARANTTFGWELTAIA